MFPPILPLSLTKSYILIEKGTMNGMITTAKEILRSYPDKIMLSNGPGDPKVNRDIIRETGRVYISSQSHGYAVDTDSLDPCISVPAFVNVNDNTNEGLRYIGKNIFTVQYHPEACPGPIVIGQAGLNLAMELCEAGFLEEYHVRLIGTTAQTIRKAESIGYPVVLRPAYTLGGSGR